MAETRPPYWSTAEIDAFEQAHDLLGATIAACSARIAEARDGEHRSRLLRERDGAVELQRHLVAGTDAVAEILAQYPEKLRRVRAGEL